MRLPWRYVFVVAALAAGLLLLPACGGEEEKEAEEAPTAAAAATEEGETPEAAPTKEEEEEGEVQYSPSGLEELDSYRYRVEFKIQGAAEAAEGEIGFTQEGAFVAPDRSQAKCTGSFGPIQMEEEVITIGETTYVKSSGSASFAEGEPTFCTSTYSPEELGGTFITAQDIQGLKGEKEEVNGVDAIHFSIDRAAVEEILGLARAFGAEATELEQLPEDLAFNIDVWVAEDGGWPVKQLFEFSGTEEGREMSFRLEANVTDVNSDIEIEAP